MSSKDIPLSIKRSIACKGIKLVPVTRDEHCWNRIKLTHGEVDELTKMVVRGVIINKDEFLPLVAESIDGNEFFIYIEEILKLLNDYN